MRRFSGVFRGVRLFSSASVSSRKPSDDRFDGITRSSHIKQQFVEITRPDGSLKTVATGLIDNSHEWIGDQFVSMHMKISRDYDLTLEGFAERSRKRLLERNKRRQVITPEMIQRMGSLDLAVAHMVCNLGGRVQFQGRLTPPGHWHQRYNKSPADIPSVYSGDLKLEAIDFSGTSVMYEGLKLLPQLTHLKVLRLRRCLYLDDHGLSLVGQITESPLELLDISECHRLSANGLTALTELKSLRRLLVHGNPTLEQRELVCLLLEDHLPNVYIEGVDYIGKLPEDAKQRLLALEPPSELSGGSEPTGEVSDEEKTAQSVHS